MSALAEELCGIDLGDRRLNRRACRVLERLGDKPMVSIPAAYNGWSETRAAYRLFDTAKVTAEAASGTKDSEGEAGYQGQSAAVSVISTRYAPVSFSYCVISCRLAMSVAGALRARRDSARGSVLR